MSTKAAVLLGPNWAGISQMAHSGASGTLAGMASRLDPTGLWDIWTSLILGLVSVLSLCMWFLSPAGSRTPHMVAQGPPK